MILKTQYVELLWSVKNKKKYTERGYEFTGFDTTFLVKPLDLPKKSEKIVCAICDVCGKEMSIAYAAYYKNIEKNNRYVCQLCSIPIRYENDLEQRRNNLWEKISVVAENNDYKIISDKNDIYRNSSYISYECKRHGVQSIRIGNLLSGKRCPDCARDIRRNMYKNSTSKIKRMVDDCGGKILNIEEYINQDTRNLLFVCQECGKSFISSLKVYKQHGGQVCEECSNGESLGEKKIRVYLDNHKIHYEQEKCFYDCRDKAMLPFDFYLPDDNMIIEFDGRQHYSETNFFSYSIEQTQKHDRIKNQYCNDKGITLVRIPYTQINNITKILDSYLHKDIV